MTSEQIQSFAAIATFLAACVAVWATLKAPNLAATFAERLRADAQRADEERRLKMWVFSTLMQQRSNIASWEAVSALNMIDVVYNEARDVREAWRNFLKATGEAPCSSEKIIERYYSILEKMAVDLGLSKSVTISDIHAAYFPEGLGHQTEAAHLELQEKLARLRNQATKLKGLTQ